MTEKKEWKGRNEIGRVKGRKKSDGKEWNNEDGKSGEEWKRGRKQNVPGD